MTHWRLGEFDVARRCLREAEDWRLKNLPGDVELLRFRAEAETLIRGLHTSDLLSIPKTPTSVAEALRDSSFRLPAVCPSPGAYQTRPAKPSSTAASPTPSSPLPLSDLIDCRRGFFDLVRLDA